MTLYQLKQKYGLKDSNISEVKGYTACKIMLAIKQGTIVGIVFEGKINETIYTTTEAYDIFDEASIGDNTILDLIADIYIKNTLTPYLKKQIHAAHKRLSKKEKKEEITDGIQTI